MKSHFVITYDDIETQPILAVFDSVEEANDFINKTRNGNKADGFYFLDEWQQNNLVNRWTFYVDKFILTGEYFKILKKEGRLRPCW